MTTRNRSASNGKNAQLVLPLAPAIDEHLDISALEQWLWDAACAIRGATDAPKFKDFILPLVFYKRLSDVFDDEFASYAQQFGDEATARKIIEDDHEDAIRNERKPIVRFYIPAKYHWQTLRNHPTNGKLGEYVTEAMREVAKLNRDLEGVLDVKDYNERQSNQRTLDDDRLAVLIEIISRHRLGLKNAEPDILGRAYEYLLRKFAEGQGQSAGEFYTPQEVGFLMAELLNPAPKTTIYDPTCGSGGLLIKARLVFEERNPTMKSQAPKLYGQELYAVTYAMAKMNMFLHDFVDSAIAIGDTFRNPKFATQGAGLLRFDYVVANPMWNQPNYTEDFYENDVYNRFTHGTPPNSSADWGWAQLIVASLKDNGRAAVILDTNAVSRGSGNTSSKERDIRKAFVEQGIIEAVILLPENLFYNTGAPGIILVFDKSRQPHSPIRLINASRLFAKGSPKNYLDNSHIQGILDAARSDEEIENLSTFLDIEAIRDIDYDLSPARHVPIDPDVPISPLPEAIELVSNNNLILHDSVEGRESAFTFIPLVNTDYSDELLNGWIVEPFAKVVTDLISGDWGEENPDELNDFVRCAVIRGTDFPAVERSKLTAIPYRYIGTTSYARKQPRAGDLLIEISGGGKYQNTGRVLYLDESLLANANPPILFSNFTKLLRIDQNKVLPKYAYHAWSRLYSIGRTARYEKQPTNIKNFKFKDFLKHEVIMYPRDMKEQQRIVDCLDAIHLELLAHENHISLLEGLRKASMSSLLQGIVRTVEQ